MAGSFPTLKSGNTVWYPLEDTQSFGTGVLRFVDDSEQRWRNRSPLRRFKLSCVNINGYDLSLIFNFFRSQFGRFDSSWDITIGGETIENLSFNSDSFSFAENVVNRYTLSMEVVQAKTASPAIPSASPYFPQLNSSGLITSLPYQTQYDFKTTLNEMQAGKRYSYKWRSVPLGTFQVQLDNITDDELSIVQDFFYSMNGRLGEFTYLDPGGNLVNYSDDFSNASWTKQTLSVSGSAFSDPFGGSLAKRLTSSGSNALLYTTVIPSGNASGFVVCASVWAKAAVSMPFSIGFVDSGFSVIGSTQWDLEAGVWKRIYHSMELGTNSYIRVLLGGFGNWTSGRVVDLFSAQCSPMAGMGPRILTPGLDGLRAKCRFGTDDFSVKKIAKNLNSLTLPIVEYT